MNATPARQRSPEAAPAAPGPRALGPRAAASPSRPLPGITRCPCGGGCPRCAGGDAATQPLPKVGPPDSHYEREADREAARVMAGAGAPVTPPPPQHPNRETPLSLPDSNLLTAGGAPLAPELRSFFEPRLGRGLGDLRLHAGPDAHDYSERLQAHAFTYGSHIWLGRGHVPAPDLLLAHELVHATLHRSDTVWRRTYETRGTQLSPQTIQQLMDQSYWERRTLDSFVLTVDPRMQADREESDAVLSVVWSLPPPSPVTSVSSLLVPIAARALPPAQAQQAPGQAPALLYRITFRPPVARGGKPRLELEFVASGAGSASLAAPAAPASFTPSTPGFSFSGFGGATNAADAYFAAHPEEHRALFNWMENSAPASFDQIVTTATTVTSRSGQTSVTHRSVFHVSGSNSGGALSNLAINLVSQGAVQAAQSAPANYRARDAGDWRIEQQQARTPAANRLGTITGMAAVPADERVAVKAAIAEYFSRTTLPAVRDAEVDVQIPLGASSRTVLYSLVFAANNDVTVTRIGEAGTGTGQVDIRRIDVARVRGFPGAGAGEAALRAWWGRRYPRGGALPSTTASGPGGGAPGPAAQHQAMHLIVAMNSLITSGIANPAWFNDNWGIEVLDAAATATRLQTVHGVPAAMTTDTTNFDATDLRMLELGLETLADGEFAHLRGVKLGRKTASIRRTAHGFAAGTGGQYGVTLMDQPSGGSSNITVLYFQSLYLNDTSLFRGSSAANALPDVVMGLLHELGHATGYDAGIKAAFDAWISAHPQASPTWYAASNPAEELFPEAFALYHTDPRFLCNNSPMLYAWFDALATTGSAPAASATLTPPATCP